jgi:1-acyl-sn-glycerol-3-phosphate acyltransferase
LTLRDRLQNNLLKKAKSDRNLFYKLSALIIRLVLHINGGLYVKGKDNTLVEGGVIVASNHISYLDPPLIAAVLPRRATFMARKGLFNIPLLGWFISHYAFPVDREKTLPSTIKEAVRRLKNGELLVMFPEGRRSETGEILEGKRGIGMIAHLSKAVVVPVLISGTNKALPVGAKWLKRAKISVIFGDPIDLSTVKGEGYESISQKIMCVIGELKKLYADNSG